MVGCLKVKMLTFFIILWIILAVGFIREFSFSATESKQDLSLSISTHGAASINVSVEVNGTIYSGESWFYSSWGVFCLKQLLHTFQTLSHGLKDEQDYSMLSEG